MDMGNSEGPVLAIDVGTSVVKCGLVTVDGSVTTDTQRIFPKSSPDGTYEVNPEEWLRAVAKCVAALKLPNTLAALVVTGNGPTVVPAASNMRPLLPAITWLDRRSTLETQIIAERTGLPREASFFMSKIYWIYRHEPKLYRETHGFVSGPEFVALRLTGCWHTALASQGFQRFYWDEDLVEAIGIDAMKLPPFIATGTPIGTTSNMASDETGIPVSTPVFAGAPDYVMALLGTAAVSEGITCNRSGSSDGISYCSAQQLTDPRLLCLPHIVDNLFTVSGLISTTGRAIEWFAELTGGNPNNLFEYAAKSSAGAGGLLFLPYLAGERTPLWRNDVRALFSGLGLEHSRAELSRAVLEGIGYALRDSVTLIEEHGCRVETIRIAGAPNKSHLLNQIKADILGRPLLLPQVPEAELIGCACIASYALTRDRSIRAAANRLVKITNTIYPRGEYSTIYDEGFAHYKRQQEFL